MFSAVIVPIGTTSGLRTALGAMLALNELPDGEYREKFDETMREYLADYWIEKACKET